ncbi:hypothetical protein BCAR13_1840026 [Paraburkholderia caribensis]|nr:hypothetical protein BCAR13_1840026 [Paraburkholderia caribensis]
MLPSHGFVTFFETHFLSTSVPQPSVCSRLQQGLEVAIKLLSHGIDLLAAELAENGGWSIIFKPDTAIAILAQQHTDGCIQSRRQLMAGHLRCGERIADIVLDGSARQPSNSQQRPVVTLAENSEWRTCLQLSKRARAFAVSQKREDTVIDARRQGHELGSNFLEWLYRFDCDVLNRNGARGVQCIGHLLILVSVAVRVGPFPTERARTSERRRLGA